MVVKYVLPSKKYMVEYDREEKNIITFYTITQSNRQGIPFMQMPYYDFMALYQEINQIPYKKGK